MTAEIGKAAFAVMTEDVPSDGNLQAALFDAVCDGLSSAVLVYDKNDLLLFASRHVLSFFPIPPQFLQPSTRLRDYLGAVFDTGVRHPNGQTKSTVTRDDWISQRIASHWRERFETTERLGADRWVRFVKRRLPSGFGVCILSDISEVKKREEQWRIDMERVQLTEDILDNLPFPLFVKDCNMVYVAVNKAFSDKYQTTPEEVLGRKGADLFSTDLANRFEESDRHVIETGEMSITHQRQISRDGIERDVVTRKQRIGKPGRYFLIATMQDLLKDGADFDEFALASEIKENSDRSYRRAYVPMAALQTLSRRPPAMETFVPENFSGRKILVVTSDLAAETAAVKMLAKYGFDTCSVHNENEEAAFLDVASSLGVKIDLVIVDNQLGNRGVELAERQSIPALSLDGSQLASELTFLIARHFNRNIRRKPGESAEGGVEDWQIAAGGEEHGLQILVAEDNDINQIVFSQILEGLGYRYMIAPNGDEAVRLWNEHRPELVLMDISLPGLNGFEAARLIRRSDKESGTHTPIIGVLTQAFERDRKECADAGMDDVILKPVSPDILETVFQKYMRGSRKAQARQVS
ncbi:response regulator [Agrobacterium rhizogenes]|nr:MULTISPECIES: response regulator [Rhizobium]KAA6483706.1 response regulator [Agrobacterium sp. ICMP 7243]OCI98228.1 histidine kinase [Agrobacterium sp. 13-626]OCJ21954.1 histidine kinase [Agrobacterium sp. B131/95]OCJ26603.1 histidine kinase [Agrobacterium sp. B133/95]EJK80053.1 PAS domain S-box [Rhizobium sp. AP16]